MRVQVAAELCMGHGMCAMRAPEVYQLTEFGTNEMGDFDVRPGLEGPAALGARACPERVISIIDGEHEV